MGSFFLELRPADSKIVDAVCQKGCTRSSGSLYTAVLSQIPQYRAYNHKPRQDAFKTCSIVLIGYANMELRIAESRGRGVGIQQCLRSNAICTIMYSSSTT